MFDWVSPDTMLAMFAVCVVSLAVGWAIGHYLIRDE